MSVLDSGTIDGMATDENGKALILLISDHLDWKNEYDHLLRLQEKINSYITFCEEHQYNEFYEEDLIEYAVFEIHVDWYNDIDNYRPELPSNNRSHKYE